MGRKEEGKRMVAELAIDFLGSCEAKKVHVPEFVKQSVAEMTSRYN